MWGAWCKTTKMMQNILILYSTHFSLQTQINKKINIKLKKRAKKTCKLPVLSLNIKQAVNTLTENKDHLTFTNFYTNVILQSSYSYNIYMTIYAQ